MPFTTAYHTPITSKQPVLKAIGLGGAGQNAINRMIELGITGIEFIAANTDAQALKNSNAQFKIQLGPQSTRGLGAGGNPQVGESAAEESFQALAAQLAGADMVFLTAGMGGGTGTGSIPVVARAARAVGAVVVAIVSTPFAFEVGRRQVNAREGLSKLRQYTDTLITVPNDRLLQGAAMNLPLDLAFRMADDVLRQGIQGITELITQPGMINVDFSHIKTIMKRGGGALMAMGMGEGSGKAFKAVERALHHPMLDSIAIENATGIIANFTGGKDMSFLEVAEALNYLQEKTHNQAEIIPGFMSDDRMGDHAQVILIITGLGATPVDQSSVMKPNRNEQPIPVHMMRTDSIKPVHIPTVEMAAAQVDLDLPAFLRRRSH
ncbi:MAG: cell division protein FtsZ [Anaerolineaceae bacterium]|nr:cell division protein FtsZ [Anaerolineaceae bacterium]NTV35557.1 cell division protein FtsZ [Anaerolineaceae bacterium]